MMMLKKFGVGHKDGTAQRLAGAGVQHQHIRVLGRFHLNM